MDGFERDDLDRRPSQIGLGLSSEEAQVLQRQHVVDRRGHRRGISAEPFQPDANFVAPSFPKSAQEVRSIELATRSNFLFNSLDEDQRMIVYDAMERCTYPKGSSVISQGQNGDFFYIVLKGQLDVYKDGNNLVYQYGPGGFFGELALMYNCPRAASVVAVAECVLYRLDRNTFRHIVIGGNASKERQLGRLADQFRRTNSIKPGEAGGMGALSSSGRTSRRGYAPPNRKKPTQQEMQATFDRLYYGQEVNVTQMQASNWSRDVASRRARGLPQTVRKRDGNFGHQSVVTRLPNVDDTRAYLEGLARQSSPKALRIVSHSQHGTGKLKQNPDRTAPGRIRNVSGGFYCK